MIQMFREERQKIIHRGNECKALLSETDSVLNEALALKNLCLYVSPKTSQLHSECKNIIQERKDLKEAYDRINYTLNKKEELRSIFKRMPEIKNQIFNILNSVCQSYQNKPPQDEQSPQQLSQTNQQIIGNATQLDDYYGRFFIECRRIKELTNQLESCLCNTRTDELLLYLEEIYTLYFDIREQLIEPVFSKNLDILISRANRNYCDLLQQTCAALIRILRNEIQLFNQIFPPDPALELSKILLNTASPSQQSSENSHNKQKELPIKRQALNGFLELLCKVFYEHLRPVIIHVNHLETLTELYKLLVENMKPEYFEEPFQLTISALAEDVQERLVFRTEIFIKESISDYKPSGGDLAYPEKLELIPNGGELKDYQSMWYPTVQRAVLALLYLSRVFDSLTFSELAQDIVIACLRSLDTAQRLIDERHGGTKIEASLFLSKHLGIVKDQMELYGIGQVQIPPEVSQELQNIFNANLSTRNVNNP